MYIMYIEKLKMRISEQMNKEKIKKNDKKDNKPATNKNKQTEKQNKVNK